MRKRHVLVLAVIAVAVVLGLPGSALAVYETPTEVHFPVTSATVGQWWDLDSGTVVPATATSSAEVQLIAFDSDGHDWYVGVCENGGQCFQFIDRETGQPTRSYDSIVYADLADLAWLDYDYNCIAPFVVHTLEGNYFKVQLVQAGVENAQDWVYKVQRLLPYDPLAEHATLSFDPEGRSYGFDLDTGTVGTAGADLDISYADVGDWWVEMAFQVRAVLGAAGVAGFDYEAAGSWNDIVGVHFGSYGFMDFPASFLVVTDQGNCYKVRVVTDVAKLTAVVEYRLLPVDTPWRLMFSLAVPPYAYYADFETGTGSGNPSSGSDLEVATDRTYPFVVCMPGAAYSTALPAPLLDLAWEDVAGMTWTTSDTMFTYPATSLDLVAKTAQGRYFAVNFGEQEYGNTIWYKELRPPNDPPRMLTNLGSFIASPTVGAVSPAGARVLGAEVNLAAKALAQGHPKVAVALLKVVIAEVKVLPARVVSAEARAEIIAQANAIIAAINQ